MAQARVLMLVSCLQAAPAQQSACEEQAACMATSALAGQAHSVQTVSTLADWNAVQQVQALTPVMRIEPAQAGDRLPVKTIFTAMPAVAQSRT